jgi:hypothetical protein
MKPGPRQWSARRTLLAVALVGWAVAGFIAWTLVARLGWFGVLLLGLATLFIAARFELDDDNAAPDLPGGTGSVEIYAQQLSRKRSLAERVERNRLVSLLNTIGIALTTIGLFMFVRHQL